MSKSQEHGTASQQMPGWYVEFQMAVLRALPRDINQEIADGWRANGEGLAKNLRGVLIPQIKKAVSKNQLPVGRFFMTVTLGEYSTVTDLRQAILSDGKNILDYADQILEKIEISPEKVEVDLWEISGVELGFTEYVSRSTIYQRAFELGFEKSPVESIILSRIKCGENKWRIGGMKPEVMAGGGLCLLGLASDYGGLWLHCVSCDNFDDLWHPNLEWIFVRPRRK